MDVQYLIVLLVIGGAAAFGALSIRKRLGSFSVKKKDCGNDCGCGTAEK